MKYSAWNKGEIDLNGGGYNGIAILPPFHANVEFSGWQMDALRHFRST